MQHKLEQTSLQVSFSGQKQAKGIKLITVTELIGAWEIAAYPNGEFGARHSMRHIRQKNLGYKLVFKHHCADGSINLLTAFHQADATLLFWQSLDITGADEDATMHSICELGAFEPFTGATAIQDIVILVSPTNMIHLAWANDHYVMMRKDLKAPRLNFALQKIGNFISTETIVTDSATAQNIGINGSGASTLHPVTTETKQKAADIGERIAAAYNNARTDQVLSKGYFDQPFFLQYALRLADGTHIHYSPPMLMLPTALPPIIGINSTVAADGTTSVSIDLSSNSYHALRYRIIDDVPEAWCDIVTAIDVFVSSPIMTYQPESIACGEVCTLQEVVDTADTGTSERGRNYPSRADDPDGIFAGHYSQGFDNYVDHTLECPHTRLWKVSANPYLQDQLAQGPQNMFLISSIPLSQATAMDEFETLPLLTTHHEQLATHSTLDAEAYTTEAMYSTIIPSAITTYGSQAVMAAQTRRMIPPSWLNTACAYAGNAQSQMQETEITVYIRLHNGQVVKTTANSQECRAPLSDDFPRYIHYPDPDAFMMTLRQNNETYTLPLTRDGRGTGTYWWGGLLTDCRPPTLAVPEATEAPTIPLAQTALYISIHGNPLVAKAALNLGCSGATGFAPAMQAPYAGTFGQYPLYLFTTDGIMLLKYNDDLATFTAAKVVSNEVCTNPRSIATTPDSVIFATASGIKRIEGSKVTTISQGISDMLFDISTLPHADELLELLNAESVCVDEEQLYQHGLIHYDTAAKTLIVSEQNGEFALIRSDGSDIWSWANIHITDKVGDVLIDSDNNIVSFAAPTDAQRGLLNIGPIIVDSQLAAKSVSSVEIIGCFNPRHVSVALYGAVILSRWHLIDTIRGPVMSVCNKRPYRYLRLCIVTELDPGEWISGALFKLE